MTQANISRWQFYLGSAASPQVLSKLEEVRTISNIGKTNTLVEATNFDSPAGTREYIAGLADGDEISVECNYIPGAANQTIAMTAVDSGASRLFRVAYTGSSPEKRFTGQVVCLGYSISPSPTEVNSISFTFKISGDINRT